MGEIKVMKTEDVVKNIYNSLVEALLTILNPNGSLKADSIFTDRGDPADWDYTQADLTTDGTWRDLDLSSIVPDGAKAVLLYVELLDDSVGAHIRFRKNGNSNSINISRVRTQITNLFIDQDLVIPCDANRIIEYNTSPIVFTTIRITVKGWWK